MLNMLRITVDICTKLHDLIVVKTFNTKPTYFNLMVEKTKWSIKVSRLTVWTKVVDQQHP